MWYETLTPAVCRKSHTAKAYLGMKAIFDGCFDLLPSPPKMTATSTAFILVRVENSHLERNNHRTQPVVRMTQLVRNPDPSRIPDWDVDHVWSWAAGNVPGDSTRVLVGVGVAVEHNPLVEICGIFWDETSANVRFSEAVFDRVSWNLGRTTGMYRVPGGSSMDALPFQGSCNPLADLMG